MSSMGDETMATSAATLDTVRERPIVTKATNMALFPQVARRCSVSENIAHDWFTADSYKKIVACIAPCQKKRGGAYVTEIYDHIVGSSPMRVLNGTVLQSLLGQSHLIPESFKNHEAVLFLGTSLVDGTGASFVVGVRFAYGWTSFLYPYHARYDIAYASAVVMAT